MLFSAVKENNQIVVFNSKKDVKDAIPAGYVELNEETLYYLKNDYL